MERRPLAFVFLCVILIGFIADSSGIRKQGSRHFKSYGIGSHVRRNVSSPEGYGLWPSVFNLATKAMISVNATCGESGREEFCRMVEGGRGRCGICDNFSSDPGKKHPIGYAIDGTNRWWQSPALQYGREYEHVTLTIDLKQVYQIAYVIIKAANSPRPGTWILERSLLGNHYEPWQYFARSDKECLERFGVPATKGKPHYFTDSEVICTSFYSRLTPMENGEIHTSLVHGRPGANETSPELLEFTKARFVRLRLMGLRGTVEPLPRWFTQDIAKDKRLFYTIRDISIGGQCVCNGHAENCRHNVASGHPECECGHHTCGPNCEKCCPMFNQRQWGPGSSRDGRQCLPCNCHGHATSCHYDENVDRSGRSMDIHGNYQGGGVCNNCTAHTTGINCEKCIKGYYRPFGTLQDAEEPCVRCDCDPAGSKGTCVQDGSLAGTCDCLPGFAGPRCDTCAQRYRGFPNCESCPCDLRGTGPMEDCEGECICKVNVEGKYCNQCKSGHFALRSDNSEGCLTCICSGVTTLCESAVVKYSKIETLQDWMITDIKVTQLAKPTWDEKGLFSQGNYELPDIESLYWLAPAPYLGNKLESYNSILTYKVHWVIMRGDTSGKPTTGPNIILIGQNGLKIAHGNDFFTSSNMTFNIGLVEDGWYHVPSKVKDIVTRLKRTDYKGDPVNRRQFLSVLSDIKSVLLRATFHTDQIEALLEQARLEVERGEANSEVERCSCPSGYTGLSCETCAFGYVRIFANSSFEEQQGFCGKCDCNGHSESCNADTGDCFCQHNTLGESCERCAPGFYGNPSHGTPDDCKKCACPLEVDGNNFSPSCQLDYFADSAEEEDQGGYVCTQCPTGYTGDHCEICDDGYFGNPMEIGNSCIPCDCNGGPCDRLTGQCLRCKGNTEGWKCERCKAGHYGDASSANCKDCQCDPLGAVSKESCNNETGQCICKERFTGRTCDKCETGYGNVTALCTSCACSPTGSKSSICDPHTGLCDCHTGVEGFHCDTCQNLHYGFSETGCKACNCDPQGSQFPTCEQHSGQCLCKSHFTGLKCDRCEEGYWKDGTECVPCLCDDEGSLSQSCDQQTGICFCKAGVAAPTCNACLPNHYGNIIEGCKECDVCDKEGYICDPETGKCVCPPLTMGLKCEKCKQNTYGNPGIGCKACECSHSGSSKLQCDKKTGRCTCKVGFEGEKCDRCSYGYYGYKHCKKCNCDPAGTIPEDCSHDSCRCTEDGCRCKANVRGKYCDTCKEGTFGVDLKNLLGCTECFCFGRSRNCSSAGYSWEQIQTDQVTQDTCIDNAPCWTLPSKFTGDLTSTYGGFLRVTSNSALPSNNRIFLTGNGITIGARAPEPEVMMVENNWRVIQDTLPPKLPQECANFPTRACLLAIFQNVTKIQIEIGPSFRTTDFTEVVLDKAVDSRGISRASTVEGCQCPKEYTSLSCQDPSSGYYRYYPKELETNNYIDRIIGIARRCHCNNKSHVCDRQTGHCQDCSDHTTGPHCEFCITGYYKDMSGKCLPCLCPTDKLNFAASCEPEPGNQPSQFVCNCLPGYTGAKCDRCEGTYFGSPWKDGFCQPCDCNPYGSESQICNDATGACVCKAGFTGRTCSQCVSPREVIQNGVCTPCDECTQILFNTLDNMFLGLNKTLDLFKDGLGPPWPVLNLTLHRYKLFSSKFDSDLNKAYDLIENAHLDELEEKVTTLNNYLNLKKQKADQQIKAIKGLQADSESISEEAVVLQNRINEIIKNLHEFGQSHVNTQDAVKEARTLLKDINEKSSLVPRPEEYEDLFKKCDDLTKEINEVYKGDNNSDEMKANLSALKKRLGALNSLLDQTEVMNKLAKNKNKRNTARIAKLNETISDINARNYAVNGELTDLVGLINATTNLLEDIEKLYEMLSGIDIEGTTKQLEGDSDEVPQLYDLLEKVGDHVKDLQDKIKTYKSMFNFTSEEWKKINASAAYENLVKGIEEAKKSANEAQDIITEAMKMLMGEPEDDTLSDRASIAQGLSDRLKQRIRNLKNPTDEFKKIRDDLERLKYEILKNGRNNNDLTTVLHNMRQQIKKQSEHVDDLERVKEEAGNVSDRMANIEKEVKNLNITTQYDLIKTYHKYLNLTSGDEISKLQDKVTLARMELQDLHINFTHIDIIKKINDEKFQNTNENLDSIEAKINILKNKIQYAKQAADSINIAMDLTNCARHYRLAPDVFKTVTLTFKCKTCNLLNLTNSKGQFLTINVVNKDIVVGLKWKHQEPTKIETKTLRSGDNTTTIQIEKIGSIMELRTEQGGTEIDSATIPIGKELFKIGDEEHYLQVGKIGNQEEACLQRLVLNDHVIGLWNFVQSFGNCPGCQKDTSIAGSKILFGGNGYRNVTGARNVKPDMVDLQFYFTTFDETSLLFLAQDKENRCSYIALTLINGYLELRVRHIDGTEVFLKSKRRYNNGIETRVDIALLYRNGLASYSLSVEVPNSEPDKITETKKLDRASVFKIRKSEIFLGGLPGTFDKHCIPVTNVPFLGYLRSGNAEYNDPVRTTSYDTKLQSGELRFTKAWFSGEGFLNLEGLGQQPSQDHTSLSFLLRQPSPNGFVMNFGDMLDIYLKNEKLVVKINENPITMEPSLYKDINYIEIEINKDEVTVSVNDNPPTSIGKIKISKRNLEIYLGKDKDGKEHPNYVGGMSNIVLNNKTISFDVGTVKEFSKVEIGREKPLPQSQIANKNSFGSVFEPHSIREMQNTEGCAIVTNYETDPDAVKLGDKKDSYIFVENSFWRRDYVLELQFRTFYPNGLLFLSMGAHQQKQFNLLEIKEGKVQLKMKGKKMKVLTMPDKVNDGVWHYVQIKQSGVKKKRKLTISLDGVSKKPVRMPKSNVKGELYVGGVPNTFIDYIEIKNQMHSFRGCMKSLKINNVLQVLVKNKKNVSYNNIGQCFPRVERGAYFSGDSYAIYKGDFKVNKILELSLEFRTPEQNGILLSVSNFGNSPALSVELQNGAVVMTIDMGNGAVFNVTNSLESEFTLCNNKWHNITALYSSSELTVNVDGIRKTWVQLDVNSLMDEIEAPLYVGGLPDNAPSGTLKTKENFKGCIRKLKIEDRLMDWTDMKELSNVLLHSCPVIT